MTEHPAMEKKSIMEETVETLDCPCGSEQPYSECCQPLIQGERAAETAEQMMRSRYTAYTKVAMDYILETTHPDQREGFDPESSKAWAEESTWHSLEVQSVDKGGSDDETGEVTFLAHYTQDGKTYKHHERASFKKEDGRWYFFDGEPVMPKPYIREQPKVGRNDPCHCGSGKKYKKCCMRNEVQAS